MHSSNPLRSTLCPALLRSRDCTLWLLWQHVFTNNITARSPWTWKTFTWLPKGTVMTSTQDTTTMIPWLMWVTVARVHDDDDDDDNETLFWQGSPFSMWLCMVIFQGALLSQDINNTHTVEERKRGPKIYNNTQPANNTRHVMTYMYGHFANAHVPCAMSPIVLLIQRAQYPVTS